MLRRRSLERRLFGWMLVLALVPALGLVALGTWVWSDSLDRISTLGPWDRVGESGREVFDAAAGAAASDPALAAALERHREELSASLLLARRWAYLRERVVELLPGVAVICALLLAGGAFAAARGISRGLARPIRELVGWAERLAREEELPTPRREEGREVQEVRALRSAFREAAAELRVARVRALEAERVRVWGEMARRVAHEMKNPLTPLRLALHRLARSSMEDDGLVDVAGASADLGETVTVIAEEVDRLEELAHQFAQLGRPPEGPTSPVDLRELLASLLATDVAPPVEVSLAAAPGLPLIEGHYEALVRAFRNLIRNAVEAMEGCAGTRRVEVRIEGVGDRGTTAGAHVVQGGAEGRVGGGTEGRAAGGVAGVAVEEIATGAASGARWVEVRIADRGHGLPEGAEARIFEPDFTTKSRGTGLGLALVRQAVRAHGGTISLARHQAGGAEFVVRLPVERGKDPATGGAEGSTTEPGGGPVARTEEYIG